MREVHYHTTDGKFTRVTADIITSTDKAYKLQVHYRNNNTSSVGYAKIWCPKSCCKVVNDNVEYVASFLLDEWAQNYTDTMYAIYHVVHTVTFEASDV